jgi:hypothetical protein
MLGVSDEETSFEETGFEAVKAAELELLDPTVRADPRAVARYIDDGFVEVGGRGTKCTRDEAIALLAESPESDAVVASDFEFRRIGSDAVLLTFRLEVSSRVSYRASIWVRRESGWKVLYHQGTRISHD